jgi:lysosomal acid lipase/cholesteryl ester hydrolase
MLNGLDSIAFKLIDAGFDVWLNNSRGSIFSREHQLIDLHKKGKPTAQQKESIREYWNFSFHEHGIYDQPALWNFVIRETGQTKIQYVCHS